MPFNLSSRLIVEIANLPLGKGLAKLFQLFLRKVFAWTQTEFFFEAFPEIFEVIEAYFKGSLRDVEISLPQ